MAFSWLQTIWQLALAAAVVGSTLFTIILITLPAQYKATSTRSAEKISADQAGAPHKSVAGGDGVEGDSNTTGELQSKTSVQVVVLGDIGRSPRMQYHALSIAKAGGHVNLVGYQESDVHPEILSSSNITIVPLPPTASSLRTGNKFLFLLFGPLKVLFQTWSLYYTLGYRTKPARWMLVQNPPSIPTLALALLICSLRNTRLVIDWHNFGYSILALKLGTSHPLVRISRWYEFFFARFATAHFTVTNAMARTLKETVRISALPLHDRPPGYFQPLSADQRRDFLKHLRDITQLPDVMIDGIHSGRCKLLVSSTSWTADEDFQLLLDALVEYSERAVNDPGDLPFIIAIITGKGPQKDYYLTEVDSLAEQDKLGAVAIQTAWLSSKDYASLLGAADLGISLHKSSSGVDLPMKVVDMFGAGLPVAGWSQFEAWPELVKEGINGRGFSDVDQLVTILIELFGGSPQGLASLKNGALGEGARRWDDEWNPVAGKLFALNG
ncbi:MAG: mannosyltransferase [Bathelium mastoideum]|nr:MAG: mannosyltransferase [Bathelium mastoideum]